MAKLSNRALCCNCGTLRTVSVNYRRLDDPNRSFDDNEHPLGWRCTLTLRCSSCRRRTRHATLRDFTWDGRRDDQSRDVAETRQHLAPGSGLPLDR